MEYCVYGNPNAEVTFLAFHGFGRPVDDYALFEPLLKPNYRLVSVSLFAHGENYFPEERVENNPLTKEEWKEMLRAFLHFLNTDKVHYIGYSMGGRVVMMSCLLLPESVGSVLLIAPDGLKINNLYRFASGTSLGRRLSSALVENPSPLFRVADFLLKVKILHPKLHRFVYVHMDTLEKRRQVFDAWLIYKQLFPDLNKLAKLIEKNRWEWHMIFGKYDSVIKPRLGIRFKEKNARWIHTYEMPLGHRLFTQALVHFVADKKLFPPKR
jgi:pimeloyl-ACP methyl ester carboxylesterase